MDIMDIKTAMINLFASELKGKEAIYSSNAWTVH